MPETTTHITTSGGLISAAFIENIRELGTRQRGIEPNERGKRSPFHSRRTKNAPHDP